MRTDLGPVTAYAAAVAAGYTGTAADFARQQADYAGSAKQVAEDRTAVESAKQSVDQTVGQFDTHAAAVERDAIDAIQTAGDNAKTEGVTAVQEAQRTGVAAVESARESGVEAVQAAQGTGVSAVNEAQEAGVSAVTAAQKTAQESIETARTDAVQVVETAKTEGVAAVNAAVEDGKSNFVTDETLTLSGRAADAKAVGDELAKKADKDDAMSWSQWFDLHRTGWHGGVTYEDGSPSTIGTKTGDNADLVVIPSTNTEANRDDYKGNLMWDGIVVNGYYDANGDPHITAVEGSPEFALDGSNGDVYVAFLSGYYNAAEYAKGNWDFRDTPAPGYIAEPKAIRADESVRSFYLVAKYPMSIGSDGLPASISGKPIQDKISQNNQIAKFRAKGDQYCGITTGDIFWFQSRYEMKYARRSSDDTFTGCTGYTTQAPATVEESGVKRVIISKGNASALMVGSYVSIGHGDLNNGAIVLDRGYDRIHEIARDVKILKIEPYDDANTAIYVDVEDPFDVASVALSDTITSPVYVSTCHWWTGSCDDVQGSDGSPYNCKDYKNPFMLSHVEFGHGAYEVVADIIFKTTLDDTDTFWQTPYIVDDAAKIATSITEDYVKLGVVIPDTAVSWKYISKLEADPRYPFIQVPVEIDGSSSTYCGNVLHTGSRNNNSQRQWLWFGNLNSRSGAGLRCVGAHADVDVAWGSRVARLSSLRRGVLAA